jgi:hypothetical protein
MRADASSIIPGKGIDPPPRAIFPYVHAARRALQQPATLPAEGFGYAVIGGRGVVAAGGHEVFGDNVVQSSEP